MIFQRLYCSIALIFMGLYAFAQDDVIQLDLGEVSLEEVISRLEADHGFLFSFKNEDVENVQVLTPSQSLQIEAFLTEVLKTTQLGFEKINEKNILLRKLQVLPKEEERLSSLSGKVIDSLTQAPLAYANIYLVNAKRGVVAKEDGTFELEAEILDEEWLVVSFVGYQSKKIKADLFLINEGPTVALNYYEFGEDFIVVVDYLTDGISLSNNGLATELRPERIGALPGQPETDVLRSLHFLPGVSSTDGTASSIHIRGGTPDQNLILWEEIPIYHSAHFFGMISAFNPFIIDKTSVYRGGFQANHGGRVSGLIEMKSGINIPENPSYKLGSNFLNGFLSGKVPVQKGKGVVVFSFRNSFTDLWRSPTFQNLTTRIQEGLLLNNTNDNGIPEGVEFEDDFSFSETYLKTKVTLGAKDDLSFAFFYNTNDFKSYMFDENLERTQTDSLQVNSLGGSLVWNRNFNNRLSSKIVLSGTDYGYDYDYLVSSEGEDEENFEGVKKSEIQERKAHLALNYQTKKGHKLDAGYEVINYDVSYLISKDNKGRSNRNEKEQLNASVHALFATFHTRTDKKIGLNAGLRTSYFEKETSFYLEPRLHFWWKPQQAINLSLNAGRYYQFSSQLLQIDGDRASIETPVWVLAGTKEVPVLSANQIQLGGVYQKNAWLLDIQLYWKQINGLTSLATGFDEGVTGSYYIGKADIRGLDVLLKKRWNNYQTWTSYSFSQSVHFFEEFFDPSFRAPNDRPHKLNWVHKYSYNNWDLSLAWRFQSGALYSNLDFFELRENQNNEGPDEVVFPLQNVFNSERLAPRHQLDASLQYHHQFKESSPWNMVFGFSFLNLYNRENLYERSFFIDRRKGDSEISFVDRKDLGITPNLMIRIGLN